MDQYFKSQRIAPLINNMIRQLLVERPKNHVEVLHTLELFLQSIEEDLANKNKIGELRRYAFAAMPPHVREDLSDRSKVQVVAEEYEATPLVSGDDPHSVSVRARDSSIEKCAASTPTAEDEPSRSRVPASEMMQVPPSDAAQLNEPPPASYPPALAAEE